MESKDLSKSNNKIFINTRLIKKEIKNNVIGLKYKKQLSL